MRCALHLALLALFGTLPLLAEIPKAQSSRAAHRRQAARAAAKAAQKAPEPAPVPQPPPPPPTPAQLPANPPTVTYHEGMLSIVAENSNLGDILAAVRSATGATIDMPPGARDDRVYALLGPGPARDVLASLLKGSHFDYILLGNAEDPDAVQRILLSARTSGPVGAPAAARGGGSFAAQGSFPPPAQARPGYAPPSQPVEEDNLLPQDETMGEVPPYRAPDNYHAEHPLVAPAQTARPAQPGAEPKSPEQLLQELQRMQKQEEEQRKLQELQKQQPPGQPIPSPQPENQPR